MIIAVTGPMASGKNYICSQFEAKGWVSLDCDKVVHEAVVSCGDQIFETFSEDAARMGIDLLKEDGSINRRALGAVVFSDPELLKKQEDIVYPYVIKRTEEFLEANAGQNLIINATVLFKTPELLQKCEKVIYVSANPVKRFFRARRRDKLPVSKILARFHAQKDLLKKYRDACSSLPGITIEKIKN